jgi:hypothetical protein
MHCKGGDDDENGDGEFHVWRRSGLKPAFPEKSGLWMNRIQG